jgi:choline dehydrogenase-like flavoprotein
MKNKHTDAIVVGAGAGGGVVAKELAVNGFRVVLFERGDWHNYDKNPNDELTSQRGSALEATFGPDLKKNPRVMINTNENGEVNVSSWDNYGSQIAACVGSGTVSYGAMAWRYMPEDFKMKSTYGEVEGSTLDDWPVSYDDLEPYYEKAEYEIGVAGDDSTNPFGPPRKNPFPMPPFENNEDGVILAEACKRLGLHPFPIPMARNSVPYNGRAACIRNRTCVGFACPVEAKNGTHNTVIPTAIKSGNCELRTNCKVAEILMGDNGKAIGVRYFDENDKERTQTADIVVISAAAIESARLLLSSKTKDFPNGLGNNNDWVGRNIQGHVYSGVKALFDRDIHRMAGPGATFAICDFNHHNEGIIGGGLLANEFYNLPYSFTRFRPPGEASWGLKHKEFQKNNFFKYTNMFGPIQEMPNFSARVMLYDKKKDYWGRPIIAGSGSRHPLDVKHSQFLAEKAEMILKEAGASKTWKQVGGRGLGSGQHQTGTCRMGDDPQTSVVNKYGQVHDIDNLYVVDGSIFVTGGGFNPALTIMALGYWCGKHIVDKYK